MRCVAMFGVGRLRTERNEGRGKAGEERDGGERPRILLHQQIPTDEHDYFTIYVNIFI